MQISRESLKADALRLRADLAPYCATSLAAAVLFHEAAKSEKIKRNGRDAEVSLVEYLALLLLPQVQIAGGMPPTDAVVADAADRCYAILDTLHRAEIQVTTQTGSSPLDQSLSQRFRMAGLTLRNPGVPEHWDALLYLFAQGFDPKIERWLPFSLSDALAILRALRESMSTRSLARKQRWHEVADRGWAAYRNAKIPEDGCGIDFAELFSQIRAERLRPKLTIYRRVSEHGLCDIDTLCFVDIEDVARRARLDTQTVQRFMASFTLDPRINDDWLLLPSSRNMLSRTPFIETQRGYFVPSLPLLQWALLPRIEELLNPASRSNVVADPKGWKSYERQRSRFLERTTARILHCISDSDPKCNTKFILAGASTPYEIDVLTTLDTTTYVVECKSTTLSDATWRGSELSVETAVQNVLREATVQLDRAIKHLREARSDSAVGRVAPPDFVPIVVTLDHAGPISAGIRAAQYAEATSGAQAPWVLSLLDLFTLQDLLETRWRFKHYARRRLLAVTERRDTMAYDELDFYHLYCVLNVCAMPAGASHFLFLAPTGDIDNYYSSLGTRKHKKPGPATAPAIQELIRDLEREGAHGWSDVACDLLDLSRSVTDALAKSMVRMQTRAARDGIAVTRLRQPDQGFGIIYAATNGGRLSDAVITAQLQTAPMTNRSETYLIIAHDARVHRVFHGVFERDETKWTETTRTALQFGEEGLFFSISAT